MKTNYLKIFIILFFASLSQIAFSTGAITNIPGAQKLIPGKVSDVPKYVRLDESKAVSLTQFPMWASTYFGLSNDYDFSLINSSADKIGFVHYRYQQTYKGIPVEGTMYILHTKNGKVVSMNGELLNSISSVTSATVNEQLALSGALADINASVYKWQVPSEENHLKAKMKNQAATYFPKGELVFVAPFGKLNSDNLRLAWKFDVYAVEPLSRNYIYVDATTGEVIKKNNRIHTSDANGTAVTAYSGNRTIVTDSTGTNYRLHETGRGGGIITKNMLTGTNYANAVDFTDADNYWNNVNAQLDQYATDAHWGAEMTYDYYLIRHNRHSVDDADFGLESYVHYNVGYNNAFWDGQVMTYGDGSGGYDPFTGLDITGHEITHGVTTFSSNLDYQDEPGALNESFSDIFGTAIEFFARPTNANWLLGSDIGVTIRNMSNPNSVGDPDTYMGNNWYTGAADNGGVHTNSNVQNYWFYLLSQGGSGTNDNADVYNVTGIGIVDAAAIAYRNNCFYLTNTSDYADSRFYSIQAAIDLFGACTQQVISTTNAWYAVGVGGQFTFGVTANFTVDQTTSCSVPFTVNFTNQSTNAGTFVWDFGDANTSTQNNPSHTYTNYGVYTVTLHADGGACGSDSIVQTALINLADMSPVAPGATICKGDSVTLTATGTSPFSWYSSPLILIPLATGSSFTTPPLTANTSYYVSSAIPGPSGHVGPTNNTIGTGGNHNSGTARYDYFDVLAPCTLVSATVYSSVAGNRTINLWDNGGNIIQTWTMNIPNGTSVVTFNQPLSVGTQYRIGGTNMNLYRNNSGTTYPYTLNGLISITGSNGGSSYFYYFYDWNIQSPPCITNRTQVPVNIALLNESNFSFTNTLNTYNFSDLSTTATSWFWNFGDLNTSTQQNPVHTYLTASGSYTVMHIVSDGTCSDTSYQTINVINGVTELSGINSVMYPNPATSELRIKNSDSKIDGINIYDMLGKKVLSETISGAAQQTISVNIAALKPAVYSIEVIAGDKKGTARFAKQ